MRNGSLSEVENMGEALPRRDRHAAILQSCYIPWKGYFDIIGMVDVFVVAILVAVVQLGSTISIHPGAGAISFAAVVVLTMFAAMSFDPRLIWDAAARSEANPQ